MQHVDLTDHFLIALVTQNPQMRWTTEWLEQICYDLLTYKTLYLCGLSYAQRLQLYRVPPELALLPWIKAIHLSYTALKECPEAIFALPELETLVLRGTLIRHIPEHIGELQTLRHLDLSDMNVPHLPQRLGSLGSLQTLVLPRIDLQDMPESIQALKNLRILDLRYARSSRHMPDIWGGLEALEVLRLDGMWIESCSPALANCRNLRFLSFYGSDLKTIPAAVFELPQLEELILSSQMEEIPPAIKQLQSLRKLVIYTDRLNHLPSEIGALTNLEYLELCGWNPLEIPASLSELPKLKHLDVGKLGLNKEGYRLEKLFAHLPPTLEYLALTGAWYESLRTSLPHLLNLRTLIWGESGLEAWPDEFEHLSQLQTLDLAGNFATIPPTINHLKQLRQLNLRTPMLKSLPDELGELTQLRSLSIQGSQLLTLPPELGNLLHLEQLGIWQRGHPLEYLAPEICQLSQLRSLTIDLQHIPPEIGNLAQLEELRCEGITNIPAEIGQLSNLRKLTVCSDSLIEVPATLGQLAQLQILHLNNTNLHSLPPEIGNLTSLRTLWLNQTYLQSLPPEFGNLHNLQVLWLQRTPLQHLPPEIGNLHNLRELDLGYTAIKALPATIGQMTNLDELTIPDDDGIKLPPEMLELKQLRTIRRSGTTMMTRPFNTEQIFAHECADHINSFQQLWQRYLDRHPDLPISESDYEHTRLRPEPAVPLIEAFLPREPILIQGPLRDCQYAQAVSYLVEGFAPRGAYRIVVYGSEGFLVMHFLSNAGWYPIHRSEAQLCDLGSQIVIAASAAPDAPLLHVVWIKELDLLNSDQLVLRSHGVILPFIKVPQQLFVAEQLSVHFALLARLQRWKIALEHCPIIWLNVDAHHPDGWPNEFIEAAYLYLFDKLPIPRFWAGLIPVFPNYGIEMREAFDFLLQRITANGEQVIGV